MERFDVFSAVTIMSYFWQVKACIVRHIRCRVHQCSEYIWCGEMFLSTRIHWTFMWGKTCWEISWSI